MATVGFANKETYIWGITEGYLVKSRSRTRVVEVLGASSWYLAKFSEKMLECLGTGLGVSYLLI